MAANTPTIIATSGGLKRGRYSELEFGGLINYAIEISNSKRRRPVITFINTANGDSRYLQALLSEAGQAANVETRHFSLFPMPNVDNVLQYLLDSDVIWVGGGSVANLLALWRLHQLPEALHTAWQSGIVLGGVSAGSLCWHVGGTTDSFGPCVKCCNPTFALLQTVSDFCLYLMESITTPNLNVDPNFKRW